MRIISQILILSPALSVRLPSRMDVPEKPLSYKFTASGAKNKVTPTALMIPASVRKKKFTGLICLNCSLIDAISHLPKKLSDLRITSAASYG